MFQAMEMDSENLLRNLRRHAANIAPGQVAIATTEVAGARHREALAQFCREFPLAQVTAIGEVPNNAAIVVVLCEGATPPQTAYFKTVAAVGSALPIIWGDPWRPFDTQPPNAQDSGLSHAGMFSVLSSYCPVVKPSNGAYCEFGVFDGKTFALAFHALKHVCDRFYAFDSFQGLKGTMPTENHFTDGRWAANINTFEYNLQWAGVDTARVRTIPGFFQDTLQEKRIDDLGVEAITVALIDVDIYAPAALALEFIAPRLVQGSVLMFDDYDHLAASNDVGERRALREFLGRHPEIEVEPYRNYGALSRSFLVHRR